jgi:hypothetical protein
MAMPHLGHAQMAPAKLVGDRLAFDHAEILRDALDRSGVPSG